jgi:acyl carrier protein
MIEQILGDDSSAKRNINIEDSLSDLGMTSLKMVDLMLSVEAEFDIAIPQQEITPDNFLSIASLEAMVARLTVAPGSA